MNDKKVGSSVGAMTVTAISTGAVTPISSHKRFAQKTEQPPPAQRIIHPRITNVEEVIDLDTVAAIAHIRQCAWIIAHRHGLAAVLETMQLLNDDLVSGFKP